MALTQISTDGIKNGTITGSDLATNVDLVNNQKLRLGTGNDLQIYHDGTNSFIVNNDGDLLIRNTTGNEIKIQAVSGEQSIQCIGDGAVELYFDGSRKLRTKTAGVEIEGELGMADNYKIKLGTGEDLQIFHDSNNSYIKDSGSGGLFIQGSGGGAGITLEDPDGNDFIKCIDEGTGGTVELYKAGTKRLETTTTGVKITGSNSTGTEALGDFRFENAAGTQMVIFEAEQSKMRHLDNIKATFGTGDDYEIYHDGSDAVHRVVGDGDLKFLVEEKNFIVQGTGGHQILKGIDNGAVELYHDNSKKLETNSTGIHIFGNTGHADGAADLYGSGNDLSIFHDGTNSKIVDSGTGSLIIQTSNFNLDNADGTENILTATENGAVELYYDNSKKFETTSAGIAATGDVQLTNFLKATGDLLLCADIDNDNSGTALRFCVDGDQSAEKMRIDSSGNIAIGTISPVNNSGYGGITLNGGSGAIFSFKDSDVEKTRLALVANDTFSIQYPPGSSGHFRIDSLSADGSGNITGATERMRVDSSGNVGIGQSPSYRLDVIAGQGAVSRFRQATNNQGITHACIILRHQAASSSQQGVGMVFQNSSGSEVGSIRFGPSTSYNTTSDYRLKENVFPISDGITRLKTLKPSRFNFTANPETTVDGFLAHEVTAVPEAITGSKDQVDSDNNPVYQSIDQSKLVPLLVAALQEAIGRIEVLETEVAALKAA
jgi:hypothetical protein